MERRANKLLAPKGRSSPKQASRKTTRMGRHNPGRLKVSPKIAPGNTGASGSFKRARQVRGVRHSVHAAFALDCMKKKTKNIFWEEAGEIYKLVTCSYSYSYITSGGTGTASGRDIRYDTLFFSYAPYSFGLEQGDNVGALSDRRQIRS